MGLCWYHEARDLLLPLLSFLMCMGVMLKFDNFWSSYQVYLIRLFEFFVQL